MVVNKYDLEEKWNVIKKDDAFDLEQKNAIKYAMGIIGINEDLIINPNIPSEYMEMYIRLMIQGIDVTKYIFNQWRLKDIKAEDLEKAIIAENQGKQKFKNVTINECTNIQDTESNIIIDGYSNQENKQKVIRRNNI